MAEQELQGASDFFWFFFLLLHSGAEREKMKVLLPKNAAWVRDTLK